MRLVLITEAPVESATGASAYHRRLIDAWQSVSGDAKVIGLDAPVSEDFAASIDAEAAIVVEAAAFEKAALALPPLLQRGAVALVHHPTALEPGAAPERRAARKALESSVLPKFRRVVTASEPIAARLKSEFGVSEDRLRVVVPGTAPQSRRHINPERPFGTPCTVLSLGTLTYRKGHDLLLRALAGLPDLDWRLILAGEARDPAYAAELDSLAENLGIQARVERTGALDGDALEEAWNRAEVFALATRFEGFGMAIAEAMARGLPVAITDGGAAGSLVPAQAGVVAPVDDLAQFIKALRRLVFSPPLRAEMGAAGYAHARNLPGWTDQARAFAAVFEE